MNRLKQASGEMISPSWLAICISFLKRCDFWHSLGKKCRNIKTRPSALGRSDSAVESLGIHRNKCPWNPPGRGICIASFGTRVY